MNVSILRPALWAPYSDQSICLSTHPSVLVSVCQSDITCPGQILSPLELIWLILNLEGCAMTLNQVYIG